MVSRSTRSIAVLAAAALLAASPALASDSKPATTKCTMDFNLKGWSAFYKTAEGTGKISCDNGSSASVKVSSKGGGLTFGKSEVLEGHGVFTEVKSIDDLFGGYASAGAEAGAGKSAEASVVTKGDISLSFTGKGTGVNLGFSFGKFTIEKAG